MAKEDAKNLTGAQKAAILLLVLGHEAAAPIIKKLNETQIQQVSSEIAKLGNVPYEVSLQVLSDFSMQFSTMRNLRRGGIAAAQNMLEKSLGAGKATQMMNRLGDVRSSAPFDFIKRTDPDQLLGLIQLEHPQTIALVLSNLDANQAAVVLSSLPPALQTDVASRIASMDKTTPEIVKEVESILEQRISSVSAAGVTSSGGVRTVAEILNRIDRATEKSILQVLEKEDSPLAEEIKKLMFVFEDLVLVDDRGIQQVMKEVDSKELALAIKAASSEVKDKIFKNMSKRAAEAVKEEMEFMGPVRLRQVEETQQRIVAIVRKLEEGGEIVIQGRGGKGEEVVA
jgi:flagellar motor switch protein FliG